MSEKISPFFIPADEAEVLTTLDDRQRLSAERRGEFPPRIRLTKRTLVYRRAAIEEYLADPEAWAAANKAARANEVA